MTDSTDRESRDRVLLVDDVSLNLNLLAAILGREYEVIKATNGTEALRLASASPPPDIVLLDIEMPDLDGYEVCRRLKGQPATRDIPVIFVTAAADVAAEEKGLQLGAIDYLTKPITPPIVRVRVRNHLDLRKAQKRLLNAEKMQALGQLVAGVAHEVNTPIGVALTSATFLARRTGEIDALLAEGKLGKSALQSFLDDARDSASLLTMNLGRAAELIKSFKNVSVDQASDHRRRIDLAAYLNDILASLHPNIRRAKAEVAVDCPPGISLDTYPGALAQVVTNLVMNALTHAFAPGAGGTITIGVRHQPDGGIRLSHSDDGRGMPADVVKRIFEPFFTTARGSGGSGLGLSITYNLVTEKLGGLIEVRSKEGDGTSFLVTLPSTPPR